MKVCSDFAKRVLKLAKILGTLVCCIVFVFWGLQAIQKFLSRPISSSISVINGDDGLSKLIFPAITICTENLQVHLNAILYFGDVKRCVYHAYNYHDYYYLAQCISSEYGSEFTTTSTTTTTTSTTEDYYGGGLFDDDEEEDEEERFDTVDEFLNATKLEVFDWIRTFHYGQEIIVTKQSGEAYRQEYMTSIWIPTFDHIYGPCFTFDPIKENISLLPSSYQENGVGKVVPTQIQLEFSFQWFQKRIGESTNARYYLSIHNSLEDRFDRMLRQPYHYIEINHEYNIKLSKSKFESLNQEGFKCVDDDPFYGPQNLKHKEAGLKLIEKYNCSLPWMAHWDFPNVTRCEVGNFNESIFQIVQDWLGFYKYSFDYEDLLPCDRIVFEDTIEAQPKALKDDRSRVTIQYVNPYIQVIKDSHSYDMQSLIGEVGGTLGLLLGLSFISIFDLFEQFLNFK